MMTLSRTSAVAYIVRLTGENPKPGIPPTRAVWQSTKIAPDPPITTLHYIARSGDIIIQGMTLAPVR